MVTWTATTARGCVLEKGGNATSMEGGRVSCEVETLMLLPRRKEMVGLPVGATDVGFMVGAACDFEYLCFVGEGIGDGEELRGYPKTSSGGTLSPSVRASLAIFLRRRSGHGVALMWAENVGVKGDGG